MATEIANPLDALKTKNYVGLLVISALIGIPVSIAAYYFLYFVTKLQHWAFQDIPSHFSSHTLALWWPVVPLLFAGLIAGLAIKYLPGKGGETPIDGFQTARGPLMPANIPGVAIAAAASIGLGAVVGPEGPLIALGGGLAYWAVHLAKRDIPAKAGAMIAAAGSFAAVSTLLGNPLVGAFLMMEASGLGGATMELVLVPGLLSAGIGYLIFIGLDSFTGAGTFSLAVPNLPPPGHINNLEIVLALIVGLVAPFIMLIIKAVGLRLRPIAERYVLPVTLLVAVAVALLAIAFQIISGHSSSFVLFSGQDQLGPLITASGFSVGALLLLMLLKGLAYGISLATFRGGPTFPAMFIGAAGGMIVAQLFGLPVVAGVAMGTGAMTVAMLKLPLVSVLLATVFLGADGIALMPLAIISVVTSYVVTARTAHLVAKVGA